MLRYSLLALALGWMIGWMPEGSAKAIGTEKPGGLRAAAGKTDITPANPAFLAGYGINRKSAEVHDRLMARCLVLESGETRVAFVSCDLIGMPRYQCEAIRARVKAVRPENLILAATHTHSGPDNIGMWGPDLRASGVDPTWLADLHAKIVALVESTARRLQPAVLRFASTTQVPRISKNTRAPKILDTELAVMQALTAGDNRTIATFVNYACHPEILNCRTMTADFPHWLYETVENKLGGVCLYLNGAQGGMVTADYDESTAPKGQNWKAAETIGTSMGERVLQILEGAEIVRDAPIRTQQRLYAVPLENARYRMLAKWKVFPNHTIKDDRIETEVHRIRIGKAEFLTIPGEALPNIGFDLKRDMTGQPKFLLGLTCDFLGYILSPKDFGQKLYQYESWQSVGKQMEPQLTANLRALMATER